MGDMTQAPVDSIGSNWKEDRHFLMEGHIDENVLKICHGMGWIEQLFDDAFLLHLCLGSLKILKEFVDANPVDEESLIRLHTAIAAEEERRRQLYEEDAEMSDVADEEDSKGSEVPDEESLANLHIAPAAEEERRRQLYEEDAEMSDVPDEEDSKGSEVPDEASWAMLHTAIGAEDLFKAWQIVTNPFEQCRNVRSLRDE